MHALISLFIFLLNRKYFLISIQNQKFYEINKKSINKIFLTTKFTIYVTNLLIINIKISLFFISKYLFFLSICLISDTLNIVKHVIVNIVS